LKALLSTIALVGSAFQTSCKFQQNADQEKKTKKSRENWCLSSLPAKKLAKSTEMSMAIGIP